MDFDEKVVCWVHRLLPLIFGIIFLIVGGGTIFILILGDIHWSFILFALIFTVYTCSFCILSLNLRIVITPNEISYRSFLRNEKIYRWTDVKEVKYTSSGRGYGITFKINSKTRIYIDNNMKNFFIAETFIKSKGYLQ